MRSRRKTRPTSRRRKESAGNVTSPSFRSCRFADDDTSRSALPRRLRFGAVIGDDRRPVTCDRERRLKILRRLGDFEVFRVSKSPKFGNSRSQTSRLQIFESRKPMLKTSEFLSFPNSSPNFHFSIFDNSKILKLPH